jgi:hypothetical protein
MKLAITGEVFNIGVIVMDEDSKNRVFRSINSFKDIQSCLQLEDVSSHDFVLNSLNSHLNDDDLFNTNFSNSMYVDEIEWITSDKSIGDTATELYNDMVSLRKHTTSNHISSFTPKKIITSMEEYASEHKIQNFDFRKKHLSSLGKQMDAVVYDGSKKDEILIGIDVTSLALFDFMQKSIYSAVSLSKAVDDGVMREAVLRMPPIGDKTSKEQYRDTYMLIQNDYKKVTIIDTKDNGEFFGLVNTISKKYGNGLF